MIRRRLARTVVGCVATGLAEVANVTEVVDDATEVEVGTAIATTSTTRNRVRVRKKAVDSMALRREVLRRRVSGQRLPIIAEELGIPYSTAASYLYREIDAVAAEMKIDAEKVRALECERLDRCLELAMEKVESGDLTAINYVIRLLERRTRLLGLDVQPGGDSESGSPVTVNLQIVNRSDE